MWVTNGSALILFISAALAAAEPVPGSTAEIEQVFEKAMKQYADAKSYQDTLFVEPTLDAEGSQVPKPPPKQQITLAFERPNKVAFINSDFSVVTDGKQLWQSFGLIEQYTESEAPAELKWSELDLAKMPTFTQLQHPVLPALMGDMKNAHELIGEIAEFTGVTAEEHNGEPAKLIQGVMKPPASVDDAARIPFKAWFSEKTGLLQEVVYDQTAFVREVLEAQGATEEQVNVKKYERRLRFDKVSMEDGIPEKRFVFVPGKYDKKVDELELPTQQEWQGKLVGRPAPNFTTEDLEGKKVSLTDFKGRVLVLDFWATWCAPCRMAMPHLQKLADKYQKAAVSVVGVNGDRPGAEELVTQFLQDQKLTYRQIKQQDAAELYRVMGIPYLVLIDQKGMVQALHQGFSQELMERVALQIDILLKGGTLIAADGPATSTAPATEAP